MIFIFINHKLNWRIRKASFFELHIWTTNHKTALHITRILEIYYSLHHNLGHGVQQLVNMPYAFYMNWNWNKLHFQQNVQWYWCISLTFFFALSSIHSLWIYSILWHRMLKCESKIFLETRARVMKLFPHVLFRCCYKNHLFLDAHFLG